MTDEVGHTPKFWANMKYLLERGSEIGVYMPEDYKRNLKMYCGQKKLIQHPIHLINLFYFIIYFI